MRARHQQSSRQPVEEDRPDPAGHAMCSRSLEVPVDDDDGDENGDDVHDEREEQVLGDQRDLDRRRREDLGHEQQEDDQRQQDGNTHRHLFAGVSRQVEDADAQERDKNARNDEVDCVEERLTANSKRERDLCSVVALDVVKRVIDESWTGDDVPCTALDVVAQINFLLTLVPVQDDLHRKHNTGKKTSTSGQCRRKHRYVPAILLLIP